MTEVSELALPWVTESDLAYGENPCIHDADGRLIAVVGNAETERQDQWEAHAALIVKHVNAALAASPSPTGEKVEAEPEPVAWQRSNADGTWSRHFFSDRTSVPEWESWGFTSRPVYSAETVAALVAERDEVRAKVEHFRTIYNTTVQTCQNRGRALATASARVAELEKALRWADGSLTYPVSTEINPRGYGWRPEKDMEFAVETIRAALTGGEDGD